MRRVVSHGLVAVITRIVISNCNEIANGITLVSRADQRGNGKINIIVTRSGIGLTGTIITGIAAAAVSAAGAGRTGLAAGRSAAG